MENSLEFHDLLRLLDERSTAFRTAIASADGLDAPVPTCPGWTLFDLAEHLGTGRRSWAATVAAGPDARARAAAEGPAAPREREALLSWLADSTRLLVDALREAGPDRGCWTWWDTSQSPRTCGAVARHQLQEVAVHTYDAQLAAGAPQPLPTDVALDGVDEFLSTCVATTSPWPHEPATVDYHATEGRSWRLRLSADGARVTALPTAHTPARDAADSKPSGAVDSQGGESGDAAGSRASGNARSATEADGEGSAGNEGGSQVQGSATDLVLLFYGRIPLDAVKLDGDRRALDQLIAWEPE